MGLVAVLFVEASASTIATLPTMYQNVTMSAPPTMEEASPPATTSQPAAAPPEQRQRERQRQQQPGLPAGPERPSSEAPPGGGDVRRVSCTTTAGPITIEVHSAWSPHGAARFLEMVRDGFFSTQVALFRAVKGFLCQTGVAGDPEVHSKWLKRGRIKDDAQWLDMSDRARQRPMKRGYLSFAGGGKDTRGTEFFFTFRDLGLGNSPWEVPFGTLVGAESFDVMDHWYTGYGDMPAFGGKAPKQAQMYTNGLAYLKPNFPDIDYITSCVVAEA